MNQLIQRVTIAVLVIAATLATCVTPCAAEPTLIKPPDESTPPPRRQPVEDEKSPEQTKEGAEESEKGADGHPATNVVGIGPGFVYRASLDDWSPSLSLLVRTGQMLTSNVAVQATVAFSIYDFEGIGEGYKWLFDKDSPQVASSALLMFFVPFWYSHNFMGGSITVYLSEVSPSVYLDFGLGLSSVLLQDRCFFPGWGGTGSVGINFEGGLNLEITNYVTDTFSEHGGVSMSSMFTLGFSP